MANRAISPGKIYTAKRGHGGGPADGRALLAAGGTGAARQVLPGRLHGRPYLLLLKPRQCRDCRHGDQADNNN